jgi:putative aldouronate transport system substrate-binding protein
MSLHSNDSKKIRRFTYFTLSLSMALTAILSGCSPEPQASAPKNVVDEPLKLSIMAETGNADFPQPGNEVQLMIEKYTNSKLDFKIYPVATMNELLPVTLSSGQLPMVLSFGAPQLSQTYMINAMKAGNFWDIKPYIDQYPNLSKVNKLILKNYEMNGKNYGLPRVRPLARGGVCYRQDWLENLGMKEPQTLEQFYEVAKAFAKGDPDKNGKNDTFGITMLGKPFNVWQGAPNGWDVQQGKFIRDVLAPEYLEGLKFEQKLFKEGILHPEYYIMNRSQTEELFFEGKAGMFSNITICAKYEDVIKQRDPNAKLGVFSLIEGPKGKRTPAESGFVGIMAFPKSSVKTEEDLKRILQFFDQYANEPMSTLLTWGIEGKHYNLKDGKAVSIPGTELDFNSRIRNPYDPTMTVIPAITNAIEGQRRPLDVKAEVLNKENEKYAVSNPTIGLISQTFSKKGSNLEQIIKDADVKFVAGVIDEKAWLSEISRWRTSGGDAIAEEFGAAAAER